MRELAWMQRSAERERWQRQSHAMALLANCHRDPKRRRPFAAEEFDPFAAAGQRGQAREPLLKAKAGVSWETFRAACAGAGWIK